MKYFDIRTDLSIHPINGDLLRLIDEQAISTQIKNLIFIDHYELPWKPTIGAGVPQTLFDNMTPDAEEKIKIRIKETINNHVKRAKLLDVRLKYDGINGYECTIIYRPVNQIDPVEITVLLKRTR